MDTRHLARFEFSDVGTKILMVEWVPAAAAAKAPANQNDGSPAEGEPTAAAAEAPAPAPAVAGDAAVSGWEVSWPGKSVTLPARDTADDAAAAAKVSSSSSSRRVFFLLPQDSSVPSTVTITPPEGDGPPIQVKPLPAIFPDGFGGGGGQSQRSRGVLHTIWAKKRLRELDHEIDAEMRANAESVGVEMALAERKWIVDTFLPPPPTGPLKVNTAGGPGGVGVGDAPPTPRSPISSGRLGDKLKGLKLATSPADLASPGMCCIAPLHV